MNGLININVEPEVVYAIFSEAASKNKLDGPAMFQGLPTTGGKQKIKTYSQLRSVFIKILKQDAILLIRFANNLILEIRLTDINEPNDR